MALNILMIASERKNALGSYFPPTWCQGIRKQRFSMEVECLGEKDFAIYVLKNGEDVKAMLSQSLF